MSVVHVAIIPLHVNVILYLIGVLLIMSMDTSTRYFAYYEIIQGDFPYKLIHVTLINM